MRLRFWHRRETSSIKVGRPDVSPAASAHQWGVREGNRRSRVVRQPGFEKNGDLVHGNARRSTGINPEAHEPIDPSMPHLSPP